MAFAPDPFVAFDKFASRRLHPEETVDEYLCDLQDLARLIKKTSLTDGSVALLCQDSPV